MYEENQNVQNEFRSSAGYYGAAPDINTEENNGGEKKGKRK